MCVRCIRAEVGAGLAERVPQEDGVVAGVVERQQEARRSLQRRFAHAQQLVTTRIRRLVVSVFLFDSAAEKRL